MEHDKQYTDEDILDFKEFFFFKMIYLMFVSRMLLFFIYDTMINCSKAL